MDIQYYGGNCIVLSTKDARMVVDDTLNELGGKPVARSGDVLLFTGAHSDTPKDAKIVIDGPGEYEISNISVVGIAARAHMDEPGQQTATLYKITTTDLNICIAGHIYPELTDDELEDIGMVDVLLVPVGGNGYTLDAVGALKIVKGLEPKIVIPTHYDEKGLKFPVPQQTLQQAVQGLGMEVKETVGKLKVKSSDLPELTQLVVLERS